MNTHHRPDSRSQTTPEVAQAVEPVRLDEIEQEDPTAGVAPVPVADEQAQPVTGQVSTSDDCARCHHPRAEHPQPYGVCAVCVVDPRSHDDLVVCGQYVNPLD